MVHAARKLTTLEQAFRSGTLALETGQPYAAYLKQKFGWDGVKVVPYDGGVARFLADPTFGQQCYLTSEPLSAKKQGGDTQVFLIADAGYNPYTTVVITRRELLRQKPELVRAFVAATAEGWRSYLADPRATNAVLGKLNPAMDAEALAASAEAQKPLIEDAETKASGLGSMQRARWETLVNELAELKLIEQKPNVDELFVNLR
jgi:NitT/TauT family transport system substrate-binding protein